MDRDHSPVSHSAVGTETSKGDGTFNAPVNSPNTTGSDSPSIVATDLNNDGNLDV